MGTLLQLILSSYCIFNTVLSEPVFLLQDEFYSIFFFFIQHNNFKDDIYHYRVSCVRVYRLGLRCTAVWVLAVVCWVNDRLFCETWSRLNFPYLHGLWHVLIFIAAYTALVLFSYFTVLEERPEQTPILKYWPRNDFELGIPYVSIKNAHKIDKYSAIQVSL